MPHTLVKRHEHFRRTCSFHLQDRRIGILKMEVAYFSEVVYMHKKLHNITYEKTAMLKRHNLEILDPPALQTRQQ
jgi:hypothetical protein